MTGFALLLFASVLDITDNFASLNRFVIIGDTETEAFLEKLVGYLGGFIVLAMGLVRWIPTVQSVSYENARHAKLEKSLKESEAKLKLAAQTAKLGYWHFDEVNNEYLDISEEYANIFGYSVEEFMERFRALENDMELVHPDDRAAVLKGYQINFTEGIVYRIFRRDGSIAYVREINSDILDESGTVIEAIGTLQDITEHQQVLEALENSEKHYSSLFTQLPIGVQEQDYSNLKRKVDELRQQGVKDLKIYLGTHPALLREIVGGIRVTGINNAMKDIHGDHTIEGYIRDEEDLDLWWNDQWAGYYAGEIEALAGPSRKFEAECIDIRSDQSEINVRIICNVVNGYEETWERVITIVEDITEKKQREITLIETMARAEKANKAKSEFLSAMSHELRTPMNAILGFAELLGVTNNESPLNKKQKAYADHILSSGHYLMQLIDQVLELSKIEAGKLSINFRKIKLDDIVDECLQLIKIHAQEEGIEIIDKMPRGELPILWTDGIRLTQALLNLMSNAVKYNCEHGSVTLSCDDTSGHKLRIKVTDTGMGIPAEMQQKLFQPFERLGRETGDIEGTGIGLTVTRQVIELLGGTVGFESEEGKGSTFWIDVPKSQKQVT